MTRSGSQRKMKGNNWCMLMYYHASWDDCMPGNNHSDIATQEQEFYWNPQSNEEQIWVIHRRRQAVLWRCTFPQKSWWPFLLLPSNSSPQSRNFLLKFHFLLLLLCPGGCTSALGGCTYNLPLYTTPKKCTPWLRLWGYYSSFYATATIRTVTESLWFCAVCACVCEYTLNVC